MNEKDGGLGVGKSSLVRTYFQVESKEREIEERKRKKEKQRVER